MDTEPACVEDLEKRIQDLHSQIENLRKKRKIVLGADDQQSDEKKSKFVSPPPLVDLNTTDANEQKTPPDTHEIVNYNNNDTYKREASEEEDDDEESAYSKHYSRNEKERSDSSSRGSDNPPPIECGVFVSDIARGVTDEMLKKAFEELGCKVYEATVVKNKYNGQTKGYGFVRFYNMADTYKVLDAPNLPAFEDQMSGKKQTVRTKLADPKNTLYIGGLVKNATSEQLRQEIQQLSKFPLEKFDLCMNEEGKSKGFGWATFKDHETAMSAMANLQKKTVMGSQLSVSLAQPRVVDERIMSKVKTLFVKNVAPSVSESMLMTTFSAASSPGSVEKVVIPLDQVKRTRLGHAFIYFTNRKDAEFCKNKFEGYRLEGRQLAIEWCLPKEITNKKPRGGPPPRSSSSSRSSHGPPPRSPDEWSQSNWGWREPPPPPSSNYHSGYSYGYPPPPPPYAAPYYPEHSRYSEPPVPRGYSGGSYSKYDNYYPPNYMPPYSEAPPSHSTRYAGPPSGSYPRHHNNPPPARPPPDHRYK